MNFIYWPFLSQKYEYHDFKIVPENKSDNFDTIFNFGSNIKRNQIFMERSWWSK